MTDMTGTDHTVDTIEVVPSRRKVGPAGIVMIDPRNETDDGNETVMRESIVRGAGLLEYARTILTDESGHGHDHGHDHAPQSPADTNKTGCPPYDQATTQIL